MKKEIYGTIAYYLSLLQLLSLAIVALLYFETKDNETGALSLIFPGLFCILIGIANTVAIGIHITKVSLHKATDNRPAIYLYLSLLCLALLGILTA